MSDLKGDASKWRLFAAGVDNLLAAIVCILIASRLPAGDSPIVRWTIAATGYLAYFLIQEGWWGTTLGKHLFGLTIVRLDGRPAHWPEAVWRTIFRVLEVNPLLLGAIPAMLIGTWSRRKQRLGDMAAHALVVARKPPGRV